MGSIEQPPMSEAFRDFLITASRQGYGAPDVKPEKGSDGVSHLTYHTDEFESHDEWRGGYPFSGHRTVFAIDPRDPSESMAVWEMYYRGNIFDPSFTARGLRRWYSRTLPNPDETMPVRGPMELQCGSETYSLRIKGTLSDFAGTEMIRNHKDDRTLYVARIAGGLINRQPDVEAMSPVWLSDEQPYIVAPPKSVVL